MLKKTEPKRPTRDEFELEELADRLAEAKQESEEVILTVWGREERVQGYIDAMDARTKLVHITKYGDVVKIPFMDIMRVSNPE